MVFDISRSLERIFSRLGECGITSFTRRRPGLDAAEIEKVFRERGLEPPADLRTLYAVCDGTTILPDDRLGDICFFPGFHWMELGRAAQIYDSISTDSRWNASWWPIFSNGGGDFYGVICDPRSVFFGEVVGFVVGEADQIAEFKNVSAMLETIACSYEKGVFACNGGRLSADYREMRQIARTIQPGFFEHDV